MVFLKAHWKVILIVALSVALATSGYFQINRVWNDRILVVAKDSYQKGTEDTINAVFQRAKTGEVPIFVGKESIILIPKP